MSLRAKIEAVVYAAEEPVTLAQLGAIFAPEVREIWQTEQSEATDAASPAGDGESAELPSSEGVSDALSEASETTDARPVVEGANPEVDAETTAKRAARNEDRAIREYLRKVLDELMAELDTGDRGVEIGRASCRERVSCCV